MRTILLILVTAIACVSLTFTNPAFAVEPVNGAKIFQKNCAACHIGGGNILIAEKTLKQEALETYLENYKITGIQAIIHQVKNGKNAMPAFKNKLTEQEVLEVATYVLENATKGWKGSTEP
ncbi:cytochrome c6 PetJ [Calothrix sp. 336/3]|uniref:cytochrome c6 PetJ n=1 Tax=Calothrix sp. 336/3 TaxID=1337936 RepID=UPI0004E4485B|nr:c-type cytochrome [Calothrix sp. 336/3]AKG24636.1 cytochrome C [Calothrix sp. 336/3]